MNSFRSMPLLCVCLSLSIGAFASAEDATVAEARAKLQEKGYATTIEELHARIPQLAPFENSAGSYRRAFKLYEAPSNRFTGKIPHFGRPPSDYLPDLYSRSTISAIAAFLKTNKSVLRELHDASKKQQGVFTTDYSSGYSTVLAHLSSLRAATRLLCLEAEYSAQIGDPDKATDAIIAAFGATRSLEYESTLISQYVRIALNRIIVNSLCYVLTQGELSKKQLNKIDAQIDTEAARRAFQFALEGDLALSEIALVELRSGNQKPFPGSERSPDKEESPSEYDAWLDANLIEWYTFMGHTIETMSAPHPQMFSDIDRLAQLAKDIPSEFSHAKVMTASQGRSIESHIIDVTHLRLMKTMVAIEQYRNKHGKLPESIGPDTLSVTRDELTDPYTGEFFRYKPRRKGYRLYSVGKDLEDDGGHTLDNPKTQREEGDWPIAVWR